MYSPPDAWPEYGNFQPPGTEHTYEVLGDPSKVRWLQWPISKEVHIGDTEPALDAEAMHSRARKIVWNRISRTDIPPGWHTEHRPWRIDGVRTLKPGEDYIQTWSHGAKHNVRLWRDKLHDGEYRVDLVSYSTFKEVYKLGTVYKKVGWFYTAAFERRPVHTDRETNFYLVYHTPSRRYVAGTIVHFFSRRSASVKECSFMVRTDSQTLAPTGLMDVWHGEAQKRGIETLYFIYLWQPGDPKSWKAYSDFKERFGITRVAYPPRLKRFVWGKLW